MKAQHEEGIEVSRSTWGRCLVLGRADGRPCSLPPTVTSVADIDGSDTVDSILSIGRLAVEPDLAGLLAELLDRAGPDTDLLFCEPTAVGDRTGDGASHDITASLWSAGWSVIDCHRSVAGRGRRARHQVWGRARPVRTSARDGGHGP